jgi:mannose-6-phosphate isomerase-like protein (cupin superfamily)
MQKQWDNNLLSDLSNIVKESTAHGSGLKQVFRSNDGLPSNLTQIAFGTFLQGESCEEHTHQTMDEYFFFIQGKGVYTIEDKDYELKPGCFLEIPAGVKHSLRATSETPLKFVYWGVALD